MNTGWDQEASPFHAGERQVQDRLGIRDDMENFGRRVIRDHLPEQHRKFYAGLQYLYIGSVDGDGRPWASMVTGAAGFIDTPTNAGLRINAVPHAGDPLADNLTLDQPLGILGLDLSSRRRNRVNGRVSVLQPGTFSVHVDQAFGNCPKYIRKRGVIGQRTVSGANAEVLHGTVLDANLSRLVSAAETFFIATISPHNDASGGADVSHRGGKPGFVRVEEGRTLTFPDFSGNGHFNTFGNLQLDDRVGLLFIDFEAGDILQLTGHAEVLWDGEALAAFEGAERLVRFELDAFVFSAGALELSFASGEASPFLASTGDWSTAVLEPATFQLS